MFLLSEMIKATYERKEAISVIVIKVTVIMRETEKTESVKIIIREEAEEVNMTETEVSLIFECVALMCLCMRFFDENFSSHVLHSTFTSFIKDLLLSLFHA